MNYSDYRVMCNSNYLTFHTEGVFTLLILPLWSVYKQVYRTPESFIRAIDRCDIQALVEMTYYCTNCTKRS